MNIGTCQPNQDLDLIPMWLRLPEMSAHEICSPDETIVSYSAGLKLLLILMK